MTFDITASKLNPCSIVELLRDGQVVRQPTEIRLIDATCAFVTFDLRGLRPGAYSLRVTDEDGTSDTEAVEVVAGVGAQVGGTIEGPRSVRANREYLFYVNYGNNGDADAVAPLFLVENLGTNPFALDRADLDSQPAAAGQVIQVMGTSPDCAAGVLRRASWAAFRCFSTRRPARAGTGCIR